MELVLTLDPVSRLSKSDGRLILASLPRLDVIRLITAAALPMSPRVPFDLHTPTELMVARGPVIRLVIPGTTLTQWPVSRQGPLTLPHVLVRVPTFVVMFLLRVPLVVFLDLFPRCAVLVLVPVWVRTFLVLPRVEHSLVLDRPRCLTWVVLVRPACPQRLVLVVRLVVQWLVLVRPPMAVPSLCLSMLVRCLVSLIPPALVVTLVLRRVTQSLCRPLVAMAVPITLVLVPVPLVRPPKLVRPKLSRPRWTVILLVVPTRVSLVLPPTLVVRLVFTEWTTFRELEKLRMPKACNLRLRPVRLLPELLKIPVPKSLWLCTSLPKLTRLTILCTPFSTILAIRCATLIPLTPKQPPEVALTSLGARLTRKPVMV